MRQGVVLPETPRDRRNLDGLEQDVRDSPLKGRALPVRLRNSAPTWGAISPRSVARGRTWRGCVRSRR